MPPPVKKNKFKAFVNKYYRSAIFIVIIICLFWKSVAEYYSPIYYEVRMTPGETTDTVNGTSYVPSYLKVKYETDRAFLPYEKIRVSAELAIVDTYYQKKANRPSAIIMVSFLGSEFTKNPINKYNRLPTAPSSPDDIPNRYLADNGAILLKPNGRPNEYSGKAEIVYRKKGSYFLYLVCTDAVPCVALDQAIDIESSNEVMNKRSNNLLFLIAVLTFLIWIYSEFFKKKS